jgi:dipeptidyl aminopeptidase/acylaminoacyl peptidase
MRSTNRRGRRRPPGGASVQVLDVLKAQGRDVTVLTFPGAGHGLLDNPLTDPDATPSLIGWVTSHDG